MTMQNNKLQSFLTDQRQHISRSIWSELRGIARHTDTEYYPVRVQVVESDIDGVEFVWSVWTGDPQYDTDHRGYWGDSEAIMDIVRDDVDTAAEYVGTVVDEALNALLFNAGWE